MDALVLRSMGNKKYCVSMCDTSAILCVESDSASPLLSSASPYAPVSVKVDLGEYHIQQGCFVNTNLVVPVSSKPEKKQTTLYRRVAGF